MRPAHGGCRIDIDRRAAPYGRLHPQHRLAKFDLCSDQRRLFERRICFEHDVQPEAARVGRCARSRAKPVHRGCAAEADPWRPGVGEGAVCDAGKLWQAAKPACEPGGEKFIHQPDAGLGRQVGGQDLLAILRQGHHLACHVAVEGGKLLKLHHLQEEGFFHPAAGQCLILLRVTVGDGKTPVAGEVLSGLQPDRVDRHAGQSLDRILP